MTARKTGPAPATFLESWSGHSWHTFDYLAIVMKRSASIAYIVHTETGVRKGTDMRQVIGAAAFVAMAFTAVPAVAQDYPYCLQGREWGYPGNCQFTSYAQCQATGSGTGSACGLNPLFAFGMQPQRRRIYPGW
jgi:hypothetical protein